MTVPSSTSRDQQTGNGVTVAFTVPFRILDQTHLRVLLTVAGVTTEQTLTTHYSVSGVGGANTTVTFVTAPTSSAKVTFLRNVPFTQETDYVPNDPFPAESHERGLDKLTMQIQQLNELAGEGGRTIKIPAEVSGVSTELPTPVANGLWGWDAEAGAPRYYTPAEIATAAIGTNWQYETFSGTGVQTEFTLSADPGTIANMDVSIDGVTQVPVTDYTLLGTSLDFSAAPADGAVILVRYGLALVGVIGATFQSIEVAVTAGDTVVAVPSIAAGEIVNVYYNGVFQNPSSYSVAGASIHFTEALPADGKVTAIVADGAYAGSIGAGNISHTLAADGAVTRSARSKLGERVSVFDFIPVAQQAAIVARTSTYDCAADIQAAVDHVASLNGGEIYFPAGHYMLGATLLVSTSNITLRGEGGGWTQQGTEPHRTEATTRLYWDTAVTPAANQSLVHFQTPAGGQGQVGGGIQRMMLDGMAVLPRGLFLESWRHGYFEDVMAYACTEEQFRLGVVDHALSSGPADCIANTFVNCFASTFGGSGWYLTSEAKGYRLTGGTATHTGNSCFNVFMQCRAYLSKGDAFYLENCDNNRFIGCEGGAAYGATSGYDCILGSADQDTGTRGGTARHNHFYACELDIHARSSQTGAGSSHGNTILGLSKSNGTVDPVRESPAGGSLAATITWITSGDSALAGAARFGQLEVTKWSDDTAIEPALFLRKDSSAGVANMGLAKIQWRFTDSAGNRNVDAGRIDAVVTNPGAGTESVVLSISPHAQGNDETNPAMQWMNGVRVPLVGGTSLAFQGFGTMNMGVSYWVKNIKVVGDRVTGWNAPTGTQTRGTFAVAGATTATVAEALAALIADLRTHGLIGT